MSSDNTRISSVDASHFSRPYSAQKGCRSCAIMRISSVGTSHILSLYSAQIGRMSRAIHKFFRLVLVSGKNSRDLTMLCFGFSAHSRHIFHTMYFRQSFLNPAVIFVQLFRHGHVDVSFRCQSGSVL